MNTEYFFNKLVAIEPYYWVPVVCIVLSLMVFIWQWICRWRYCYPENKRMKNLKFLASLMFVVWSVGFFLYMYAIGNNILLEKETKLTGMELCFRSVASSFDMFTFSIDSDIINNIIDRPNLIGAISFWTFFAGILTIWLVISMFGARLWSSIRSLWTSLFQSDDELCIFFGINEPTKILANSIFNNPEKKKFRLVFVESPLRNEDDMDSGWTSFIKSITHRLDTFRVARKNHARLSIANTALNRLHLDDVNKSEAIFQRIGLGDVARLIRKTNNNIHIFFLSDNETDNIRSVGILRNDTTITAKAVSYECKFYCHARYNSIHRVIEDEQFRDNVTVKVVDSSHICVEQLKQDVALQPVSYVDIEKDATVSSAFNALVIGFSEVGMDAVRFLYEFGAFVKTGSTDEKVVRSDFHCDVIDKNMEALAGLFVANAPSIKPARTYKKGEAHKNSLIALHQMDCQSVEFYQNLEKWIKSLNYVVVAMADDEKNISMAVRIFRFAMRYRDNMNHFRIMVRIHNDEDHHIRKIAEHYNRLLAAELQSSDKIKRTHQKTVKVSDIEDSPITIFGSDETTYSYEYIINEKLEKEAKAFKEQYDLSINTLKKQSNLNEEDEPTWENEIRDLMQLTDAYKGYSPTYSGVMRLRRIQRQNLENCFHRHTKQKLAEGALGKEGCQVFAQHQLFRKKNQTSYIWKEYTEEKPSVIRVLDVLAQTEHLRWNASHEILGYIDTGDENFKDEARLQHGCLKDWQELSEVIQSYDYNVVDVSLDIIRLSAD